MASLLRKMTAKTADMKKARGTITDDEFEEMFDLKKLPEPIRNKTASLLGLLKAIRGCNKAKDIDDAVRIIIESACAILNCDRATVFIVDEVQQELIIKGAVGTSEIRIPWNAGIAGTVFQSGEKLNIPDAYKDDRFNKDTDKTTGYKTVSLLTLPVVDEKETTIAVLQIVNKKAANGSFIPFNTDDEHLGEHMALQVGIILSNHLLTEKTHRAHQQVVSLLQIVKSLHSNMGINSLMFTITERSPSLVDADRCTLYLVDRGRNELWSLQGAVEIRSPIDKGLAGACASSKQIMNIDDVYKDERFNTEYDKKTGYRTRSVLILPIFDNPIDGSARQVVGVLQMINKLHGPKFTTNDEELLSSFLDIAGTILVTSQLFNRTEKKLSEFDAARNFSNRSDDKSKGAGSQAGNRTSGRLSAVKTTMAISEGLEEEHEEE